MESGEFDDSDKGKLFLFEQKGFDSLTKSSVSVGTLSVALSTQSEPVSDKDKNF